MKTLKICDRVSHLNEKCPLFYREGTIVWMHETGLYCDVVFDEPLGLSRQDIAKYRLTDLNVSQDPIRLPCRLLRVLSKFGF